MRWMSGRTGLIVAQMALAILALLVVAFTPPARGRMLLVPVNGQPVDRGTVVLAGAVPLIAGPLPGSLIVEGDRSSLAMLWERWVLVVAAPAALCTGIDAGNPER